MKQKATNKKTSTALILFLGTIFIMVLSQKFYSRFDLTQDKRYTLSESTKQIIKEIEEPIHIEVLLEGNTNAEFRKLLQETIQFIEELKRQNKNISYRLISQDELEYRADLQEKVEAFQLRPAQVQIRQDGKTQTEILYPWAFVNTESETIEVALLKNTLGSTGEERIHQSVQQLEYSFIDAINKLTQEDKKKIAFLKSYNTAPDYSIADMLNELKASYLTAPFSLFTENTFEEVQQELNSYDMLIIADPTEAFTDEHKYQIDQYLMQGGQILWLAQLNEQKAHPESGEAYIIGKDLGITDMLFKYGIRVNPDVVKDLYAAPIVLASGQERESQYESYPWLFYPISESLNTHPINKYIDPVKFNYASSIDTLPNSADKHILLQSSEYNKALNLPYMVDLSHEIPMNLELINEGPTEDYFNLPVPLAVLVEGKIPSAFENRIKPINWKSEISDLESSETGKLLFVSDGSFIQNQMDGDRPLELGYDKWTNSYYGNKEFLLNGINYMLDEKGLMELRNKQIRIPFLDLHKSIDQRRKWQYTNILLPLIGLGIFGFAYAYIRKRKYIK